MVKSVCPYCAVGCGQKVYVQGGQVTQIEGDPDSPVSRGRLCPKGSASLQLTTGDAREYQVLYRRPHGTEWEPLGLDQAMDMIADRVIAARKKGWQEEVDGQRTRRTLGFASLGGATLDNEENYLIKKLFTALGRGTDRESGPYLTLLHRPRSGDQFRTRRRDHVPAGPGQR